MKCSICGTKKNEDSDYCSNCNSNVWIPFLKQESESKGLGKAEYLDGFAVSEKIFQNDASPTYGFDYPPEEIEVATRLIDRFRPAIRWTSIALTACLVTFVGISVYQSGKAGDRQIALDAQNAPLPAFDIAFPNEAISAALAPRCSDLRNAVYSGLPVSELDSRISAANLAVVTPKLAKEFMLANSWVAGTVGPGNWLKTVSHAAENGVRVLASKSKDPVIEASTSTKLNAAYLQPTQTAWLALCELTADYQNKISALNLYNVAASTVRSKSQQFDTINGAASPTPVNLDWKPSQFKLVDNFPSFAYSPVNDFCSVGVLCAKFKIAVKDPCPYGVGLAIQFLDSTGKILDTVKDSAEVHAGTPVLFEADTDANKVSSWQISNIYCK